MPPKKKWTMWDPIAMVQAVNCRILWNEYQRAPKYFQVLKRHVFGDYDSQSAPQNRTVEEQPSCSSRSIIKTPQLHGNDTSNWARQVMQSWNIISTPCKVKLAASSNKKAATTKNPPFTQNVSLKHKSPIFIVIVNFCINIIKVLWTSDIPNHLLI